MDNSRVFRQFMVLSCQNSRYTGCMKPYMESLDRFDGQTFKFFHRHLTAFPFDWHYHREYELTLTLNSFGQRFVGDHRGSYSPFDLVLVGPNVPHSWHAGRTASDDPLHEALVFWFSQESLDQLMTAFPAFENIHPLLADARHGVLFTPDVAQEYRPIAEALRNASETQQVALLIEALDLLQNNLDTAQTLSNTPFGDSSSTAAERTKLDQIVALLTDFNANHSVTDIADMVHMSPRTLSRFFMKRMGHSLIEYQIEARLNFVVGQLLTSDEPIYAAAEKAGYHNLSHFNRQFRQKFGQSPRELLNK